MFSGKKRGKDQPLLGAFLEHEGALRHYISRFLRKKHDIEDVAQETFLRAFQAEQGREITQPKSFLFRIAHNIAVNELKKKSNQIVDYIEDFDSFEGLPFTQDAGLEMEARQTFGLHCEAVAQLSEQCRRVYLLRKVHGFSHKEIADFMGISRSTVEKHLAKGVRLCARYVEQAEAGAGPSGVAGAGTLSKKTDNG